MPLNVLPFHSFRLLLHSLANSASHMSVHVTDKILPVDKRNAFLSFPVHFPPFLPIEFQTLLFAFHNLSFRQFHHFLPSQASRMSENALYNKYHNALLFHLSVLTEQIPLLMLLPLFQLFDHPFSNSASLFLLHVPDIQYFRCIHLYSI